MHRQTYDVWFISPGERGAHVFRVGYHPHAKGTPEAVYFPPGYFPGMKIYPKVFLMFVLTCSIFKLDQKRLFSSNSGCFYTPKRCMHEHRLILKNNPHTCFYCFRFHEDDIQIQIKVAPLGSQSTSVQNVFLATIIMWIHCYSIHAFTWAKEHHVV